VEIGKQLSYLTHCLRQSGAGTARTNRVLLLPLQERSKEMSLVERMLTQARHIFERLNECKTFEQFKECMAEFEKELK
jgi:hypothetical protein